MSDMYVLDDHGSAMEAKARMDILAAELAEANRLITSYQIAKDNLELRLFAEQGGLDTEVVMDYTTRGPAQVY